MCLARLEHLSARRAARISCRLASLAGRPAIDWAHPQPGPARTTSSALVDNNGGPLMRASGLAGPCAKLARRPAASQPRCPFFCFLYLLATIPCTTTATGTRSVGPASTESPLKDKTSSTQNNNTLLKPLKALVVERGCAGSRQQAAGSRQQV